MSRITLKPLDDGQKAVEIPQGKTTIGRGPFLGCSDKKVSRNHAVLEVTNKGEVYLTPTHVNPCFYRPTADSPGQILKKDVPHKLESGDSFSLLPRAYRYQLVVIDKTPTEEQNEAGKTNGAAPTEEATKDPLKGMCNEEQGHTIVAEKTFSKDEEPSPAIEKSSPKEENNFSKKLADITDEKQLLVSKESPPPKENNVPSSPSKKDEEEQLKQQEEEEEEDDEDEHSKTNEEDKVAEEEENETMLSTDSFSKNDVVAPKSEDSQDKTDDKRTDDCEESRDELAVDDVPSKELSNEGDGDESIILAEEVEGEAVTPTKKTRRKPLKQQTPRQPKSPATKRKASPKPKGRKKERKFEFEEGSSQRQVAGRTSSRTNRQTRQGLSLEDFIVSDDEEWQSEGSEPKSRRKRGARRRDDDSGSDWEVEHKRAKKPVHKVGSGSESGSDWGTHKKKKGGPRGKRRKNKRTTSEGGSEEETDQPAPAAPSTTAAAAAATTTTTNTTVKDDKPRLPCMYGKKCYRKNDSHLERFCHPGDADYASEANEKNEVMSESENDDSPKKECPYGANCFRKNPQHKKDFKHTKKVRPQREAAKQADKKTKNSRNSDEVDSYDLNDSFLNDDSADEYKPLDSGSDYESGEKTKKLAKAAKNKRGRKA